MTVSWILDKGKFLDLDEVAALRKTAGRLKAIAFREGRRIPLQDWFLIEVGLWTGLRVAEIAALLIGDFRLEGTAPSLLVRCGKGGKTRRVQVGERFRQSCLDFQALRVEWGENLFQETPLFQSSYAQHEKISTRALQKSFKRTAARAGLQATYSIHCLRHTYGSFLYRASNHNLRLVQTQLGHSSVTITEIYTHLLTDPFTSVVEGMYGEE